MFSTRLLRLCLTGAALLVAPACDDSPATPEDPTQMWIDSLRQATQSFHSFDAAAPAGYVAELSECVALPDGSGGMGYHIGNPALIDTQLDGLRPEILLYEPQADGSRKFVGVEFVVPMEAWSASTPPTVEGMELHQNEMLGLWVLHVWTEVENPDGMFEDFNPRISCAAAP